jgi:hypothetical protein
MAKTIPFRSFCALFLLFLLLTGCNSQPIVGSIAETITPIPIRSVTDPSTPFPTITIPSPFPTATMLPEDAEEPMIWLSQGVPPDLRGILETGDYEISTSRDEANIVLQVEDYSGSVGEELASSSWVYCLVAPFPTLLDGITYSDLLNIWRGESEDSYSEIPLLLSPATKSAFEQKWGEASGSQVIVLDDKDLLQSAWENSPTFAIIPFEELEPRWKVLEINSISPLEKDMDVINYPLTIQFTLIDLDARSGGNFFSDIVESLPATNRDEEKMTVLIMTGTTALVRYTALRMEENGIDYPAENIGKFLAAADITHISNEVPFYDKCPSAEPVRLEQRFCSDPSYIQLLETVGADVIELTGNHILDWGPEPFLSTLDMYDEEDLVYYGGGRDLEEAQTPLLIEDHGNRLAFIGCSPAGPENVYATASSPGSAPCNFEEIQLEIENLSQMGYVPIFTFQHFEAEQFMPHSSQRVDFQAVAAMGAQIVSGSQSHFPQAMTFVGSNFIHYGLGNLFFDQMYGYNPHEFVDQHIIYDGKYINTVLITTMLEDYSRPRLMTTEERRDFLEEIFNACVWE